MLISPRFLRAALPALSLALLLALIFTLNPRTMSYLGLSLMLNLAVPIALATIAQLCVITVNDLDLSIGAYVGFVVCVAAVYLPEQPSVGVAMLIGGILLYAAVGALIHIRDLPSIVVTLGMSFVWLGLAVLVLPTPGGTSPQWLSWLMKLKPPLIPFPIIAAAIIAAVAWFALMRTSYGSILRGSGGNPQGDRAGRLVAAQGQGDDVRTGGRVRYAVGAGAARPDDIGAGKCRGTLHALFDRRRDPGRRRFRRRTRVAGRGGARRANANALGAVPDVYPHSARLADRRAGCDPDPGACDARHHRPRGAAAVSAIGRIFAKPWALSFVAAFLIWAATIAFNSGHGGGGLITAALTFATFFVIVGIGQMFVITLGPGNVDLSIPATMTLAGSVSMKIMDTQDPMIAVGLLAALGCGLGVGIFNYALILLLRIPPIIATLSSSFLILSAAIAYGRGLRIKPPPMLAEFTTARIYGVPVLAITVILLAGLMAALLHRTVYGRSVTAIGQSQRAAIFAGIPVERVRFLTYVLSALLAALCGYLFSGFSGGSSLSMGEQYLLASIAVVVIGGTSVAGGQGNVPGLWGAALFLFLVQSMLNTYQLSAGLRYLATGLIIIAVITLGGGQRTPR